MRLNKFVREQSRWTDKQMKERSMLLSKRALEVWPALRVRRELLEQAKRAELERRAEEGNVDQVRMSERARALFEVVSDRTQALDASIVEVAEGRSVSYHGTDFFMEVLPRKYKLLLLLAPDLNEIDDDHGIAMDARRWKYFRGSRYKGGVVVYVGTPEEVDRAIPMIRHAFVVTSE